MKTKYSSESREEHTRWSGEGAAGGEVRFIFKTISTILTQAGYPFDMPLI